MVFYIPTMAFYHTLNLWIPGFMHNSRSPFLLCSDSICLGIDQCHVFSFAVAVPSLWVVLEAHSEGYWPYFPEDETELDSQSWLHAPVDTALFCGQDIPTQIEVRAVLMQTQGFDAMGKLMTLTVTSVYLFSNLHAHYHLPMKFLTWMFNRDL